MCTSITHLYSFTQLYFALVSLQGQNFTEQLKAENPILWVGKINEIQASTVHW